MGSLEKDFVHYCCVAKGAKILQAYNGGDQEFEKLAFLCLERAPLYHKWYSQSIDGRTFFFLMEDGFIYFAIVKVGIGNFALLRFLENVRDEFKKITKKGSSRKGGSSKSSVNLQEQLVPLISKLITSLQNVPANRDGNRLDPSLASGDAYYGDVVEVVTSTNAPLLGTKSWKQEKKAKDHHEIGMRGIELEDGRRGTKRGLMGDLDLNSSDSLSSPMALHKDCSGSMRSIRRRWCRLVRLVLILDGAVCVILFLVWLLICKGFQCVR